MSVPVRNPSVLRLCGIASGTPIAVLLLIVVSGAQAYGNDLDKLPSRVPAERLGLPIVEVGLPLDFQVRSAGIYTQTHYAVDALAFDQRLRPAPAMRRHSLFESRFSAVRRLWDGVEFEIRWAMRSSISAMPSMDRQTLGTFVRFVH